MCLLEFEPETIALAIHMFLKRADDRGHFAALGLFRFIERQQLVLPSSFGYWAYVSSKKAQRGWATSVRVRTGKAS